MSRRLKLITQLFTVLLIAGLANSVVGAPQKGKGGGGGDDGGTAPPPPPMTFQIVWIDNFEIEFGNNDTDLVGLTPDFVGFTDRYVVISEGKRYVLDSLFAGTGATPRYVRGLSDRNANGDFYLCGSCDTADGIRGWKMQLGSIDGNLQRISFSILQPASGHIISAFRSVNSHGEAIGYSYDQGPEAALLYQSDEAGTVLVTEGNLNRLDSYISEIGQVVTVLQNSSGIRQAATWSIASVFSWLPETEGIRFINGINDLGEFIGSFEITLTQKNGQTYTEYVSGFYDGQLTELDAGVSYVDLNNFGDILRWQSTTGTKSEPSQIIGQVYFANLQTTYSVDEMIDLSENTPEDLDRWFFSYNDFIYGEIESSGHIAGYKDFLKEDGTGGRDTFVLLPILP